MRTTLDLPDDLLRTIKVRAAEEDRKLKDLIAELLWRGLASSQQRPPTRGPRVAVPLIIAAHRAAPDLELTPARVSDLLNDEEAQGAQAP